MKAVLLAGGKGVRLRPLTYSIPKPLLPIGEKPILEEIIERLKVQRVTDLVIAVGYRAELIETYFRDGAHLGVHIEYVRETEPLGTAGPLALVRASCKLDADEPLLVMNGDILCDIDIAAFVSTHRITGSEMTIATRTFELHHPYGVIETDGDRVTRIVEKPVAADVVSAGLYLLQPEAVGAVPEGRFFDIPDLANALIATGSRVGTFALEGEWLAIDRIEQLEDAARMVAERHG